MLFNDDYAIVLITGYSMSKVSALFLFAELMLY